MDRERMIAEGMAACNEVVPADWWTEGVVTAIINRLEPIIRAEVLRQERS